METTQLIDEVNNKREEIIAKHYAAACEELFSLIDKTPLQVNFQITSGCADADVAREIVRRMNSTGLVAKYVVGWTARYIDVVANLPASLVPEPEAAVVADAELTVEPVSETTEVAAATDAVAEVEPTESE